MYSYLAQGALLHHGTNPYRVAPEALASWHRTALLGSVSPVWRHTTAPYGPLFLWLAGAVAGLAGSHVTAGVTLLRLLELPGLALLGVFVPRLARRAGGDPIRATWLVLASPLTLLYLVGGGHNDALMAGLLVAGVTLALDRRPLAAIALCTLATAVKLPAAAGLALVVACWLRAEPAARRRLRAAGIAAGTAVAVGVACGLVAGVGVSWISGDLFSTPASVRFALTPATALAVSVWELGHGVHPWVGVAAAPLEAAFTRACFGLCAAIGLWFAWRVRRATLVRDLGVVLLAAALLGPAAWPWYLSWGLALLACDRVVQRRRWPVALGVAAVFPVMAGGQVAVALPAAPRVLVVYVTLGVAAGVTLLRRHVHRRHHLDHAGRHDPPRLATSELAA
jgi:alpha-1,6-mannosyltransferase